MPTHGRVFISYARVDDVFALQLGKDLRTAGIDIWLDLLDIRPGDPWDQAVETSLKQCGVMIVIMTPDSVGRRSVLNEIAVALDSHKRVVPVLQSDCEIPLQLRRLHYADFRSDYASGLAQLVDSLSGSVIGTWETIMVNLGQQAAAASQVPARESSQAPMERPAEPKRSAETTRDKPPRMIPSLPQVRSEIPAQTSQVLDEAGRVATVDAITVGVSPPLQSKRRQVLLPVAGIMTLIIVMLGWYLVGRQTSVSPSVPRPPARDLTRIAYNDPILDHCQGDRKCTERKEHAGLLQSTRNWNRQPINSVLLEDCMGFPPCTARKAQADSLRAVTDWTKISNGNSLFRDCMNFSPCLSAKRAALPAERPHVNRESAAGCNPETLPSCCKDSPDPAACRACKKQQDVRDECG